ncbi:MAG: hypothetical protein DLM68_04005 [Hyphomicrobiales bacterium]|nr:MAG: hypothetical protein DLM68_04005 [Hyphomicrobiales bacterium]
MPNKEALYATLLMSPGLTIGTYQLAVQKPQLKKLPESTRLIHVGAQAPPAAATPAHRIAQRRPRVPPMRVITRVSPRTFRDMLA